MGMWESCLIRLSLQSIDLSVTLMKQSFLAQQPDNLKVTVNPNLSTPVTELFFSNSSLYIEIDKRVETRKKGHLSKPKLFNVKLRLMRNTDHKNGTYLFINSGTYIAINMCVESDNRSSSRA